MKLKLSIKNLTPRNVVGKKLLSGFERARRRAQPKIAALFVDRATTAAEEALGSMAPVFTKALTDPGTVTVTPDAVVVQLADPIARAIDGGSSAFDLKRKLLSKSTKHTRDGQPYVDVPFQHKAESVPKLTRARMALSAALATSESVRNAVVTPGAVFDRQLLKGGVPSTTQRVAHHRGLRDDLIRTEAKVGKTKSVRYTTIRRISMRSSKTAWWHPGFRGAHLLKKVVTGIKQDILQIMRDSLRAEGLSK